MTSIGAGVHTRQIPAEMERSRRHGCATEFTKDGDAIFTSSAHRKKYCKLRGLHDRNGGYGDP